MSELATLTDAELVERSRLAPGGDVRAFEVLVHRHQEAILTNCRCITRSVDDAPDLAQEVFVKAFFGLSRFEGRAQFATWINRIKVNHCINFVKKRRPEPHVSTDDPDTGSGDEPSVEPEAERHAESTDTRRRIERALDALPETLRLPLVLRDLDRFSYQEIADQLGVGLSAVKMRIKRAREQFRRHFDGEEAAARGAESRRG